MGLHHEPQNGLIFLARLSSLALLIKMGLFPVLGIVKLFYRCVGSIVNVSCVENSTTNTVNLGNFVDSFSLRVTDTIHCVKQIL